MASRRGLQKAVIYPDLAAVLSGPISKLGQRSVAKSCLVSQPAVNDWRRGYKRPEKSKLILLGLAFRFDEKQMKEMAIACKYQPRKILTAYKGFMKSRILADKGPK